LNRKVWKNVLSPFARKPNKKLKIFLPKNFYKLYVFSDKKLKKFTINIV